MQNYKVTLKVTAEVLVELEAETEDDAQAEAVHLVESTHIPTTVEGHTVHVYVQDVDGHQHDSVVVEES